ncbi:hypothetical protein KUTeg_000671, partial [Tegillarca granosa]
MGSGGSKEKNKQTSTIASSKEDKNTRKTETESKENQNKSDQPNQLTQTNTHSKSDTDKAVAPTSTTISKAKETSKAQEKETMKTDNEKDSKEVQKSQNENTNSNVGKNKDDQNSSTKASQKDTQSNVKINQDKQKEENKNSDEKKEENIKLDNKTDGKNDTEGKIEENKHLDGKKEENKNSDGKKEENKNSDGKKEELVVEEEEFTPLESEDQKKFDDAVNSTCLLVKPDSIIKRVTKNITKLQLPRALPYTFSLYNLLTKMSNLQELDLANNNIGPQGFRRMPWENEYLDVSSNYFGKDYFSRCVGPALKTNTSLKTLRAESIGTTDVRLLMDGLQDNTSLTEIDLSRNSVSDSSILGKGFAECLKKKNCGLVTLNLCNCEMGSSGILAFLEGLKLNTTLQELNLGGNEFGSLENLLKFVVVAACHPKLRTVNLDEVKIKDTSIKSKEFALKESESCSSLHCLSFSNSHLTDEFWEILAGVFKGRQLPLTDINLNNNGGLTPNCIDSIVSLTSGSENPSTIRKLSYGLNKADGLPEKLLSLESPFLNYLNIRKSSCKMSEVIQLSQLYTLDSHTLTTLILDGFKLSSTNTLEKLMENATKGTLTTLSIGGCSLVDEDLKPLNKAIQNGLQLHMLKLSANRITNSGIVELTDALLTHKTHPLAVLDVSTNVGLLSLVTVIGGKYPLRTLYLRFTIKKQGESIQSGCSDIPVIPEGLVITIKGLGGYTGEIGKMLDSPRIRTDYTNDQLPTLSFEHCSDVCIWSSEEWKKIIGADRPTTDTPSWLQDPVTRKINGVGWGLLMDQESVQKAVEFFRSGEAKVFGQAFMVSKVKVKVDDEANAQSEENARKELEDRLARMQKEEKAHRLLIQRRAEEQWKRHAYRLAHPAYADGRI